MSTPSATELPKRPQFYLSLDQVRDSGLLSAERMAEVETEIERRLGYVFDAQGRQITSHRMGDLSPYGRFIYPEMPHEATTPYAYAKREILSVILTDSERNLLNQCAFEAASARRDEEHFAKAKKVPEGDWMGGVFLGDTYYEDTDCLLEHLMDTAEEPDEFPLYAWAAKPEQVIPGLDVSDVTRDCIEQWGWEEMSVDDLSGVDELGAALAAFVKANEGVVSYQPDYRKAILLDIPSGATDKA